MATITAITPKRVEDENEEVREENPARQETTASIRPQRTERSALERANRLGQTFTTGAVDLLGFPADLINSVLPERFQQIGGSRDLRALGETLGITLSPDEDPESLSERIVYEIGATSLPTAAVLRTGKALSPIAAITRSAQETGRKVGFISKYSREAAQRPLTFLSGETLAATGAGAGGFAASQITPDSESAETVGQLVGGFAPSFLQNFSFIGQAVTRGVRFATSPLTGERSRQRAARRLQAEVADPEAAAREIERMRGTGVSPARATGEQNLIALESAVRRRYPEVDEQISTDLANAVEDLERQARDIGNISGQERVTEILRNRRDYLLESLEVESAKAGEAYASRIANLGPEADSRQIQSAFDGTVGRAYESARATERQLWESIDFDVPTTMANSRSYLNTELKTRSAAADPEDIPEYVKKLINVKKNTVDVRYVQDLRSRILQDIRTERAKDVPNRNKVRILGQIQENLLEDMQATAGQSEVIDSALAYSRDLNQRFMQGRVGKLLGFERTGGSRIAPEDSIDFILRGGTPTTNVQQVINAVPESAGDISNFIKNQYAVTSLKPDGRIDQRRSRNFFEKYRGVINSIEGLRDELEGAAQSGQRLDDLLNRKNKLEGILDNRNKSVLSLYLNEPVEDAMDYIFKSKKSSTLAANLRRRVQEDPLALEGLKYSYAEHIIRKGMTNELNQETGEQIVNGARMLKELNNTKSAGKAMGLSDREIEKIEKISRSISRANRSGFPAINVGKEVTGDVENYFLDSISAIAGARLGTLAGNSNAGVSLQQASRGSTALQRVMRVLTKDKAEQVLIEAMTDDELFRDLLLLPTASPARKDRLARKLNAFIPSTAAQSVQDEEGAQEQRPAPRIEGIDINSEGAE